MFIPLLVLNYNGRDLLAECLPSLLRAAAASRHDCEVIVIDNDSTDESLPYLAAEFPHVEVLRRPNRGLCSFNDVLAQLECPAAVLLNNDIKLDEHSIDPLVAPLLPGEPGYDELCFMTAPRCWLFDGCTYEGLKTSIRWRLGLVQATSLFDGHQGVIDSPDETASAGAVLAVHRSRFLKLGGFDPLYLPGRLEDLDFSFRGYMQGLRAWYVPRSVAYHRGMATFAAELGRPHCDHLALRNTLLFQWKNLHHPRHKLWQFLSLPLRAMRDLVRAPLVDADHRFAFLRAWRAARQRAKTMLYRRETVTEDHLAAELHFFRRFHPRQLCQPPAHLQPLTQPTAVEQGQGLQLPRGASDTSAATKPASTDSVPSLTDTP